MQMLYPHILLCLCILQLAGKMRTMYAEISGMLNRMEEKSSLLEPEQSEACDLQSRVIGLKDQLVKEKDEYDVSFWFFCLCFFCFPFLKTSCASEILNLMESSSS